MNNILSHFGLVDARTSAFDKDLPVFIMRMPTGACSLKIGNRALNSQKLNLCTAQVNPTKNPTQKSRSRRFSSMVKRHIDISLPYSAQNIQHNGLKSFLKECTKSLVGSGKKIVLAKFLVNQVEWYQFIQNQVKSTLVKEFLFQNFC